MKKLIGTLLLSCFFIVTANAQKGKFTLGLDYQGTNNNYIYAYDIYSYGYYGATYNFQPRIGYFVTDNIEIGLGYKSGENYRESQYIAYNPNGMGENHNYINSSDDTYRSFSPYVKYYFSSMFVSARFSLNKTSNYNMYQSPIWQIDTNGLYYVEGVDVNEYNYTNKNVSTEISVGYVLSYNDKIFFEPSVSVVNQTADVENISTTTTADGLVTEISNYNYPKSESVQFKLNIGLSLRLGK
ncbi:MAG: hypothetical protein QNK60_03275 [Flavobacteriales bacterium]